MKQPLDPPLSYAFFSTDPPPPLPPQSASNFPPYPSSSAIPTGKADDQNISAKYTLILMYWLA